MTKSILKFSITIIVILTLAFLAHIFVLNTLELPLFENKIIASYIINTLLAITIFSTLHVLKDKYKEQLGFLFLFGSALKFVVFFVFFYKSYKLDGSINKLEFAAFFVPYMLCLFIETFSLSKWLNKMN